MQGGEADDALGATIEQLRMFLDAFACTNPDPETLEGIRGTLAEMTDRLGPRHPENDAYLARRLNLPSRGQVMIPPFIVSRQSDEMVEGAVVFGAHFLGRNGAAHGGAVAALFDAVLGLVVNASNQRRARTAFLHVEYAKITPIDRELHLRAEIVERAGRKHRLRATLVDGEVICATAEGLLVTLRPGQP